MPLNRRQIVKAGAVLGGASLVTAKAEGAQIATAKQAEASGRVVSFGEGFSTTFTLSEMPEGIESFGVDDRIHERVGRVLLAAAEKGWDVHIWYYYVEGQKSGTATGVRVDKFVGT